MDEIVGMPGNNMPGIRSVQIYYTSNNINMVVEKNNLPDTPCVYIYVYIDKYIFYNIINTNDKRV